MSKIYSNLSENNETVVPEVVVGATSPNWPAGKTVEVVFDPETGTGKTGQVETKLAHPGTPHYIA